MLLLPLYSNQYRRVGGGNYMHPSVFEKELVGAAIVHIFFVASTITGKQSVPSDSSPQSAVSPRVAGL